MSEISKAELATLLETYKTFNVLLEKVLATQEQIASQQDKIALRMYNGMAKDIAVEVTKQIGDCSKICTNKIEVLHDSISKTDNENSIVFKLNHIGADTVVMRGYVEKAVWFISIVSLLIVVVTSAVTIVFRGIDNRELFKKEVQQIVQELKNK